MSQGGWGEAKRNHEGDDGKGKFPLPIVPRAFNAIFTGIPRGSLYGGRQPFALGFPVFTRTFLTPFQRRRPFRIVFYFLKRINDNLVLAYG